MVSVKRLISNGIAALLVLAMPLAHANPPEDRQVREGNRQGVAQSQPQAQPRNTRETKRTYSQRNKVGAEHRAQRLTPEERRQLRRDIKEAGREIYPPRK